MPESTDTDGVWLIVPLNFLQNEAQMQHRGTSRQGDAFDRAIRETFGEATSLTKIETARQLYDRYRTVDLLNSLKNAAPKTGNENL